MRKLATVILLSSMGWAQAQRPAAQTPLPLEEVQASILLRIEVWGRHVDLARAGTPVSPSGVPLRPTGFGLTPGELAKLVPIARVFQPALAVANAELIAARTSGGNTAPAITKRRLAIAAAMADAAKAIPADAVARLAANIEAARSSK